MKDIKTLHEEDESIKNSSLRTDVDFIGNNSRIREIYSIIHLVSDCRSVSSFKKSKICDALYSN